MAKKNNKPKKNNQLLTIGLIGVLLYGGSQGWFKGEGDITTITNQETINQLNQLPTTEENCTISISPSTITAGDLVTGTLNAEPRVFCETYAKYGGVWQKVWEGNTDINGRVTDSENLFLVGDYIFKSICGICITNEATLTVNPGAVTTRCVDSDGEDRYTFGHVDDTVLMVSYPDECLDGDTVIEQICAGDDLFASILLDCPSTHECTSGACVEKTGFDVGDNFGGSSSGSGDGNFGDDFSTSFDVDGWTPGGPYILGARITRSWDYKDPNCMSFPEQYPMEWTFYDTNGMAWQGLDYVPVNNVVVEVCPVTYHSDVKWRFTVSVGIQSCQVEYDWNVQPYVCEILD